MRGFRLWLGPGEKLQASWKSRDPESGISKTEYCVGTVSVGCQVKSMTELFSNATKVTCNDCQLNHQGTYYITVRVQNGAGVYTVKTTDEIKVDLTPPIVAKVIPVSDVTSCVNNCTLVSNVTLFEDRESGVKSCSYAIRNRSHLVTDFVNNGLRKTVEATDLQLVAGERYYTAVRCENNVGLVTEKVSTIPVLVDDTPPTKVTKHLLGIRQFQFMSKVVSFAAVIRVVTQRFSREKRCVTTFVALYNRINELVQHALPNQNMLFIQLNKNKTKTNYGN